MRIAIIGTGIAGLVSAHLLHRDHELTIFEAADWIGGHTHTVPAETSEGRFEVDTGFIVFNDERYPGFTKLLRELGVPSRASDMSFSVRCDRSGLEYKPSTLGGLLAQPANLFSPRFLRMLSEVRRFRRDALTLLADDADEPTLGEFLTTHAYSGDFREQFLVPMAAAIWSANPRALDGFPARTLVSFFHNHRFLDVTGQPRWRTVVNGSHSYVRALVKPFQDRVRLRAPVVAVTRKLDAVEVLSPAMAGIERFDRVILATHSDQALAMLTDPSDREREILGALRFQANDVVLHQDQSLMPKRRRAWASWNYHVPRDPAAVATLTYDMNLLQGLDSKRHFLVTLNQTGAVDPTLRHARFTYHHPVLDLAGLRAQRRHAEIDGVNRTHYCGAYWGCGFHEDGVESALAVTRQFGREL